ncbi:MAG: UbiA family prenyltransferase, partial [Candidatus Thermoplasmatota archaeon]
MPIMGKISAFAKLIRLPGVGTLGLIPVIGALTMGAQGIYDLTLIFVIGALAGIYGFLLNDYVDVEVDRLVKDLQKKPLVSGEVSRKTALTISIILILLSFLFIFLLWHGETIHFYRFIGVLCIITAGILGTIYNIYGKKIVGSDFLVATSVSLVFLFGALAYGKPKPITWIIFILTFNNILYMNAIQGGLKDADHDYRKGVKNIALWSGLKIKKDDIFVPLSFKTFGMGIRIFSAVLLFVPFTFYHYEFYLWQMILLALLTVIFLILSIKFLNVKKFERDKIRRTIRIQSFLRYSLVP